MMATTDLALLADPEYRKIAERFRDDPDAFADAFARAWYKLLHRDMGPVTRFLGPWVAEPQLWQDPIPAGPVLADADVTELKAAILASGLTVPQLVSTAWAAAASFRSTDLRGGANGGRLRLEPQRSWPVNSGTTAVIAALEGIKESFGKPVSLADLIVLGGAAAVEKAAKDAGYDVAVPFTSGRGDATQEQTDVESFAVLEPRADGFRNYLQPGSKLSPETLLVDRAYMLGLTPKEMTVLVGGLRALGAGANSHGVFTDRPGTLTNDFFVNLLSSIPAWKPSASDPDVYEADGRTATAVDLVFASNSILRGISEVYAASDAKEQFVHDFIDAWDKVMMADRFDVR